MGTQVIDRACHHGYHDCLTCEDEIEFKKNRTICVFVGQKWRPKGTARTRVTYEVVSMTYVAQTGELFSYTLRGPGMQKHLTTIPVSEFGDEWERV